MQQDKKVYSGERLFIEKKRALKQQNPKHKLGTEITTKKKF